MYPVVISVRWRIRSWHMQKYRAQEYQELKKEAKKYADAQEVARRAQEMKEETTRIREAGAERRLLRRKEEKACGEAPGSRGLCCTVCWQSICMGRNKPYERC